MKFRLLAVILCGFLLLTKAAQVSLTPEFWAWLAAAGPALMASDGVRFLVVTFIFVSLLSLVIAGFDTANRRYLRRTNRGPKAA